MNRRDFVTRLAFGLSGTLAARSSAAQAQRQVIVVGAGLAGLAAASQFVERGWGVAILEARTRPGGRVYTLREPLSDGLYAEAGAACIQDSHEYTLRYVKRFGLTLDPFFPPTDGKTATWVAGRRILTPQGSAIDIKQLPFDFTDEERTLGLRGALVKHLISHVSAIGDPRDRGWPSGDLGRFEMPLAEFCRRNGASDGFVRMLAFGHDLSGMSTLHFLRDTVLGAATKQWFKIRGGNDRLPVALAATMSDRIRYGARVVRLQQTDTAVQVTYLRDQTPVTIGADYVVCALPAAVMGALQIAPDLPSAKRAALIELGSLPMARVHIQTRRRFWQERGETGWGASDDPMDIWEYSRDQPGPRGILGAYLSGAIAQQVTAMAPAERGRFVLERMERVHPGVTEHFETAASHSWVDDPWARGASAEFAPGQMSRLYQVLRVPTGRIYFAGEYTSPWSGWMNGALESGHRAADAILAHDK